MRRGRTKRDLLGALQIIDMATIQGPRFQCPSLNSCLRTACHVMIYFAVREAARLASNTYWVNVIDTRLKSLSKLKRQLKVCLCKPYVHPKGTLKLLDLPDDCLRKVVSYLSQPQDVLNFGLANT